MSSESFEKSDAAKIAELCERATDARHLANSEGVQFCADMRAIFETLTWEEVADYNDALPELLHSAVNLCPPSLARRMLSAVELAVERYSAVTAAAENELTCLHGALAALCVQQHCRSSHLHLFDDISSDLPPLSGPGQYFEHCAVVCARDHDWKVASMHAALALVQESDVTKWRRWILYELIAFGETHDLPQSIEVAEKCPLVTEIATHFLSIDIQTGRSLQSFCSDNKSLFEQLNIWPLVQRTIVAFYLRWLEDLGHLLGAVSWDVFAPVISPVSLDDLIAAGLERRVKLATNNHGEASLEAAFVAHNEAQAMHLVEDASQLAAKLSRM